jgi:hypothetical protein
MENIINIEDIHELVIERLKDGNADWLDLIDNDYVKHLMKCEIENLIDKYFETLKENFKNELKEKRFISSEIK